MSRMKDFEKAIDHNYGVLDSGRSWYYNENGDLDCYDALDPFIKSAANAAIMYLEISAAQELAEESARAAGLATFRAEDDRILVLEDRLCGRR